MYLPAILGDGPALRPVYLHVPPVFPEYPQRIGRGGDYRWLRAVPYIPAGYGAQRGRNFSHRFSVQSGLVLERVLPDFADAYDTPTITLALAQLQQSLWDTVSTDEYSLLTTRMQAGCLLTIIPPLVVYLIVQRKFTESIERSGIVG